MREYKIHANFENKEDFLKCFNELYLKGFRCYLEIYKYETSLSLGGAAFNKFLLNDCLEIIKKFNPSYLEVKTIKKEYEKKVYVDKGKNLK